MNFRTTCGLLVGFSLLVFGCEQEKVYSARTPAPAKPAAKPVELSSPSFVPTLDTIQGGWFIVATNPTFAGRIITDYISYEFGPGGSVTKTTRSGGKVETEKGTYSWNQEKKEVNTEFDLGRAGVQVLAWKQETPGKARIVYWKNLTHGRERRVNDLYVKKGTDEWNQREKKALSPVTSRPFIDPFELETGAAYRLSKETPLMPEFDPPNPVQALKAVRRIPAGGVVTILSRKQKAASPWYYVKHGISEGWINSVALVGQSLEKQK